MPHTIKVGLAALALLAAPAAAQEGGAGSAAIPLAEPAPRAASPDPAHADPAAEARQAQDRTPPARVAIELGDVEVKIRSLRIVLTLDPDRAAALGEALTGAAMRAGAEPDG